MKKISLILSSALYLVSCNIQEDRLKNIDQIKQAVDEREIKKISQSEIHNFAMAQGDSLVNKVAIKLQSELKTAIADSGVPYALKYCNVNAMPLTKGFESGEVTIKRTSLKYRNSLNAPSTDIEKQLLEAYQYSFDNGQELKANIQIAEDKIYYTKPILTNALCLNCHGEPEKSITVENHKIIQSLYPEDKATGYKADELRGIWFISFDKKALIKNVK